MCRYWIRMALGAPAPAEAEGKTGSDPPSPQEDKQLGWKHIAAFAALLATTIISVADTYLTIKSFHTLFTPFNILSTVVGWILAHRLWRYWKRMALRATGSEPAEPDGKDRLLKLVGKYYLKQGKNAEVVKLYEGADLSEAYPEDLVILALANIRLGNYETALKYYNDKRLASVSIKNLAADFPGIDTPNHLEASLLRIFAQ
jgi:tetratricopeptide (TPR) repeat protein